MKILIRKATLADVSDVRSLEKGIVKHERTLTDNLKTDEDLYFYDIPAIINDTEKSLLVVVEDDRKVIGCGFGQIRDNAHYYKQEQFGYIGMMSVLEDYRGQGLGGKILEALLDFFRQKNIKEAKLQVVAGNDGAIRSYEKMGFKDHLLEMKCDL